MARFARQTERSGGQKGRGLGGRNFCPPSLSYLEQDIEREIYREQKAVLLSEKKSLEEKMARIEQKHNDWLEPMKEWIKVASNLVKIARDNDLLQKKVIAKEIFGSNLRLASRAGRGEPVFPYLFAPRAGGSGGGKAGSFLL